MSTRSPLFRRLLAGADRLAGLRPRWRLLIAAMAGGVSTAALPPAGILPLGMLAFTVLVLLLDGVSHGPAQDGAPADGGTARSRPGIWPAFWTGWAFGLGQFAAGLYWIGVAFFVDAAKFGALAVPAVLGLAAGLGIFTGLVGVAQARLGGRGPGRIAIFAVLWVAAEWLRGHVLTGFPWNLAGSAWLAVPPVAQAASVVGIYGLGLLAVLVFTSPALLVTRAAGERRPALALAVLVLLVVAGSAGWGMARLSETATAMVPDVRLRLVQAAIDQREKWRGGMRAQHMRAQIDLTRGPGFDRISHVIWPETAVGYYLEQDAEPRMALAAAVPSGGLLITGAPRVEWVRPPAGAADGAEPTPLIYNSVLAIDGAGRIQGVYDKAHLVPFGEYVPLRSLNPFPKLTEGTMDFSAGPGPATLALPGLPPASPLICYEAIFPGAVTAGADPATRPGFLLNVTNDGWFGLTAGPFQHFAAARMRAIEEGLPLVRAANNGISAIVDPLGRIVALLPLDRRGVLDGPLPVALAPTIYARMGDEAAGIAALLVMVAGFLTTRRNTGAA
ncbi:apolipoprotein N-acyltransferase [Tistrella bauzanensis]|uniref:apolipoprotein N-acyltransferase n=1 Tax=Tistrella bauzanensis TaxID=657419 RepID=UPI001E40EDAD|nr:apolipoprotein N-acyltransferase [Tistrella bauzanensis]